MRWPARLRRSPRLWVVFAIAASLATSAHSGDGSWTRGGPFGASAYAFALDPVTPAKLYVVTGDRVFRSTDAGTSWTATSGPLAGAPYGITELAVDPSAPATIYVAGSAGVFCSEDAGATWSTRTNGLQDPWVLALTIDPVSPSTLYAGAYIGVYKSTNKGLSWVLASTGIPTTVWVHSLAIDPRNPAVLYAGTGGGIYKTTTSGAVWSKTSWTPTTSSDVQTVVIDPVDSATVYAGTGQGAYKSVNAGLSWFAINSGLNPWFVDSIAIDPANRSVLYAEASGVYKSTNGGASWVYDGAGMTGAGTVFTLAVDPRETTRVFAGAARGAYRSLNSGGWWAPATVGLSGSTALDVRAVATDPGTPSTVYAATAGFGVFRSADSGATWSQEITGLSDLNGSSLAVDPAAPATLYAGTGSGRVFRSADSGATWTACGSSGSSEVTAVVIGPESPATIYAGTSGGGVVRSLDSCASWTPVVSGLWNQAVRCLAADSTSPGLLLAGTDSGVFKSADGGDHWALANSGFTESLLVRALAADPESAGTFYAGTTAGAYKSTDAGASWQKLAGGETRAFAFDGEGPARVFAATSSGVRTSVDGGATWTSLGLIDVVALAVDPRAAFTVFAGRPGSSVWQYSSGWTLTVAKDGNGQGTVTSVPAAIDCGALCAAPFDAGVVVTLAASASAGSTFVTWGGACSGSAATCEVTIDGARRVTATFALNGTVAVELTGDSTGAVVSSPPGIDCGSDCAEVFAPGSLVTLTASPIAGAEFAGWNGAGCTGTADCVFTADSVAFVQAEFSRHPGPPGFHTTTPCRVYDSRVPALGGPNPLQGGTQTSVPMMGRCGIPGSAMAVSLNVTAATPAGQGHLRLFPAGSPVPFASFLNFNAGLTRANNGLLPLGDLGAIAVYASPTAGSVHVIIDVNGYFE